MIDITIDDINLDDELKVDPKIIKEFDGALSTTRRLAFSGVGFNEEDLDDDGFDSSVKEDFKKIIIWETEIRMLYRNTAAGTSPKYGGFWYSAEAYMLWMEYRDPCMPMAGDGADDEA